MYDWLLFLHVLSAFLLIGAMAYFWAIVLATRAGRTALSGSSSLSVSRPPTIAIMLGTAGTLIFGIWLAIYLDEYQLWDGWIIASLALFLISAGAGTQSGRALTPVGDEYPAPEARRRGVMLHAVSSSTALLILILMIFKPGA